MADARQTTANPKKLVSRKYATEDERVAAEVDVEQTTARADALNFDFSFGVTAVKPLTTTTTIATTTTSTNTRTAPNFSFATPTTHAIKDSAMTTGSSPLSTTSSPTQPPPKISRTFATEDARVNSEASVDETNKRLQNMKFDFNFK